MRMALILKLLAEAEKSKERETPKGDLLINKITCKNPRCITSCEQELDHVFKWTEKENGICRCLYCESKEILNERMN